MITGSHNPGDENGFKMMRGKASFFGADIQALRALIEDERFAPPPRRARTSASTCRASTSRWSRAASSSPALT